ncbi:MAG: chromosomal replication initiator protein DnaA [Erysipelotrichaceae bacterium]|nr:chromosomal replication initiator protein DnaA [Erysipelotrichaceae bacterium]
MQNLDSLWEKTKKILKEVLESEDKSVVYKGFFEDTSLVELNDREAIVLTKYQFHALVLNDNENLNLINSALKEVLKKDIRCRVVFEDDYNRTKEISGSGQKKDEFDDNVMPEYTFDNFVHGPSNKEAYSAALAVATNPGRNIYNPLFIYGDSGLGKTHLLCAVGNYIKDKYPEKKILYISSIDFVNRVGMAIRGKYIEEFKNQLNSLDVLMVDDIQSLSGKEKTNEVFFTVYNELFNNRKQIILTSDRQPAQIKDVEKRLISRFSQGLSVTVTSPEFDTALKILKLKMKTYDISEDAFEPEVLSYMATNFASDVRSLEGSLNTLLFYSINNEKETIDLDLAMEALKGHGSTPKHRAELQMKDILNAVSNYYGLTRQQIVGKTRTKNVSNARHITMYLCRKHLDLSYDKIGNELGGRDHSTVLSGCEKIDKMVRSNEAYQKVISDIEQDLLTR